MIDYSVVFIHFNFLSPFKSSFWNIVLALFVDLSLSFILYFFLSLFISLSQTHKHTLSFSSGIVTTALTAYGENFAMKFLSASESTVIYSTEPLWGTAFAGTFYSTVQYITVQYIHHDTSQNNILILIFFILFKYPLLLLSLSLSLPLSLSLSPSLSFSLSLSPSLSLSHTHSLLYNVIQLLHQEKILESTQRQAPL